MIRRHPSFVAIVAALGSALVIGIVRMLFYRYPSRPVDPGCTLSVLNDETHLT